VITEYALPRKLMPHDVIVDAEGIVWFSMFDEQFLGRFDPRALKYAEYPIPVQRPDYPKGTLDLEVDPQGNLWLSHMFQSGAVKFDKRTRKFTAYPLPKDRQNEHSQQSMVGPQSWTVDNKLWINDAGIPGLHRLDMKTGQWQTWRPYENMKGPHSVYGIYADSKNNIFFMDFGGENVGRIDAKTGELKLFPTPTPRSRPRRGRMDAEDRVWFAEWRAEQIGMFDTRTEKFNEWKVPGPYTAPYDVVRDKTGKVWTAGMNRDRVLRLDLDTGEYTEYPLPSQTNIRRVFVDNSTTPPTFWVGNNHHATLVKVEPLD
jgi:streptogramin lyase